MRAQCLGRSNHEFELQFCVTDTGVGIPPEKHSLIFEAFAQADTSTTRTYAGTGLGLAVSSRLVGMMGGRLWVDSAVGRGSTFCFTARFGVAAETPAAAVVPSLHAELLHLPVIVVGDIHEPDHIERDDLQLGHGRQRRRQRPCGPGNDEDSSASWLSFSPGHY